MEILLPLMASSLVATGIYLMLSRAMIRLIIGLSMFAYGVNLSLFLAGGMETGAPPLLNVPGPYRDPLPQALILTAIVIGFATTALLLVLAMRAYQEAGTDHVQNLAETPDPAHPPELLADPEHPSLSPERAPGAAPAGESARESAGEIAGENPGEREARG